MGRCLERQELRDRYARSIETYMDARVALQSLNRDADAASVQAAQQRLWEADRHRALVRSLLKVHRNRHGC